MNLFITAVAFIGLNGYNAMNSTPMKCVSISNQECRVRPVIILILWYIYISYILYIIYMYNIW